MSLPKTSDMSYEEKANKIPQDSKDKIITASNNVGEKLHPPESDVVFLFEMFHEYITYYPLKKNINCNSCRVMVRDFWKRIVNESWI
jgi:hypothetical protein